MNFALFEETDTQHDVNAVFGQRRLSTEFLEQLTPIIAWSVAVLSWIAFFGRLGFGPLNSNGLLGADNHLLIIFLCSLILSVTAIFHTRFSSTVFFTINSLVLVILMLGVLFASGTFLQSGAALLLLFVSPIACLWMGVTMSMAVSLLMMFSLSVIAHEVFAAESQMQLIIHSIALVITMAWSSFTIGLIVSILRAKQARLEAARVACGKRERSDPLTNLPNKQALLHFLQKSPSSYRLNKLRVVNYADLEGARGYPTAVELIRELIDRVARNRFVEAESFCYLGAGHLLFLTEAQVDPNEMASEILASVERPFDVVNQALHVIARLGISEIHKFVTEPSQTFALAMSEADFAADLSRNGWDLFNPELSNKRLRQLEIRRALSEASTDGSLALVYQPKVDLRTGSVVSAEALLRWQHPALGGVSPTEFIPIAESTGSIEAIGDWVLNEAMSQLHQWRLEGQVKPEFSLAINISSQQLMNVGFTDRLLELITEHDIPASNVELELTESSLIDNKEVAIRRLQRLRTAGFRVAIDDFGTGFSSLAYIDRLPADVLKVDRSFVIDLTRHQRSVKLTESIIHIAQRRRLVCIAEGADSRQQVTLLQSLGCEQVQGYFFSPAVAPDMFPELVSLGFADKVMPS